MRVSGQIFLTLLLAVRVTAMEELEMDAFYVQAPPKEDLALMSSERAADVTVISREMIEQSGALTVPDLLRNEANVLIRSTTGNVNDGQISMRGFGENSHLRTLIVVDGHKMNRPDMGVATWQNIPLNNIERIEVIRGGQNVLYGDHALAGVISITSKKGQDAGTQAKTVFGDFDYIGGFIGRGDSLGPVDTYVSVDGYESGGFRSNSLSRASTVSAGLTWNVDPTDTVSFRFSHTDGYQELPGSLSYDDMFSDPTQSRTGGDDFTDYLSAEGSIIWKTMQSWGESRISAGYNRRERDTELEGIVSENIQSGFSIGPRVKFGGYDDFVLTGLDVYYDTLDHTNFESTGEYVTSEGTFDRITIQPYVFAQYRFSGNWFLGSGARYEYASTDNQYTDYDNTQINPYFETNRGLIPNPNYKNPADTTTNSYDGIIEKEGWAATVSLTKEFNRRWSGFIRYDRVYRYPVLDEAAAYQEFPLSDSLNEDLDPEIGDHYVIGLKRMTRQWRFQCSAFALLMDNEIQFVSSPDEVLNKNIGETRRLGADVEVSMDKQWYGLTTRCSVQDATFAGGEFEGNTIPLAPPFYGVFSAWVNPVDPLRLTFNWSYVAEQFQGNDDDNRDNPKIDAYNLYGVHAQIAMSDYMSIHISMDNLLDETYATVAYSDGFYPGPGRSFRVALTLDF